MGHTQSSLNPLENESDFTFASLQTLADIEYSQKNRKPCEKKAIEELVLRRGDERARNCRSKGDRWTARW